jgi:hypothetical protein
VLPLNHPLFNLRPGFALTLDEQRKHPDLTIYPNPVSRRGGGIGSDYDQGLQIETHGCIGCVARPRGVDRRSREGGRRACRRTLVTLTTPLV